MKSKRIIFYLIAPYLLYSCVYLQSVTKQDEFIQSQETNPGLHNLKHIIDWDTFFVYGLILDESGKQSDQSFSVAAYSDRFQPHELVDVTHFSSIGTHYALNLPAGKYDLLVLADKDKNNILEQSEVVGRRQVELNLNTSTGKVLTDFDIDLSESSKIDWNINIPVSHVPEVEKTLFYPQGSIRSFGDPIFSSALSTLGMYEVAAFLEQSPTMFYTLEEFLPYKVPVIFVHGMGGTIREFIPIIEKMDQEHYMPWFYYYPSGCDLDHLAENFYQLFLSGELLPKVDVPIIIVAHSMGGLIAREAFNLQQETKNENTVALLITLASPFGGHPDAASGVNHAPMVIQSWRDLNPDGQFIRKLFRKPLPASVQHQLLYAYSTLDTLNPRENSNGVVPLYSQLHPVAKKQATMSIGFNSSHTGILKNNAAIHHIIKSIQSVKGNIPNHM